MMSGARLLAAVRAFGASRLARGLQILVTLALAGWIVSALDIRAWTAMRGVGPGVFATAVAVFACSQVFGGLRLALLLPDETRCGDALSATWAGYFWGNFLPGTVGGDFVRGFRLHRTGIGVPQLAATLLLDRLINLAALLAILAATALPLGSALLKGLDSAAAVPVGLALAAIVALGLGFVSASGRVRQVAALALSPLLMLVRSPARLAAVIALSFISLGAAIAAEWMIARQLGLATGFDELSGIICVVTLIAMLPVSLNGLGLQEASFVVLLVRAGAPAELALSFSLLVRALIVGTSVIAGLVVACGRFRDGRRLERQ